MIIEKVSQIFVYTATVFSQLTIRMKGKLIPVHPQKHKSIDYINIYV